MDRKSTRELLAEAWSKVAEDYQNGRLFYEEDAQASLYHYLRTPHSGAAPEVHINALKHRRELNQLSPDLIVCSPGHIDALVEVKYFPWAKARKLMDVCVTDVGKLDFIANLRLDAGLPLHLNPHNGETECGTPCKIDVNTVFAFVLVAQADDRDLDLLHGRMIEIAGDRSDQFVLLVGVPGTGLWGEWPSNGGC